VQFGGGTTTYLDKIEKIDPSDRETVREELSWVANWIKNRYPDLDLDWGDVRRFLHGMLDVTV